MLTNGSVTIYNRVLDKATRLYTYKRHMLSGVYIERTAGTVRQNTQATVDDKALVIIYENQAPGYSNPKNYDGINGWTLRPEDIIVLQVVEDEIENVKQLENKYAEVYTISAVDYFNAGIKVLHHWEVRAK